MFRLLIFLGTIAILAGCGKPSGKILGKAPRGELRTILAVKAGDTPPDVTLRGTLIEKCPEAGCWFRLQDDTGVMKIDTKAAGFVVLDLPLKTILTVTGKTGLEGNETILHATGLRY